MKCDEFEGGLARLMTEDPPEIERRRLLASMRTHAEECRGCGGSSALLELLGGPKGQRDIAADPGEAYWSGFEERLEPRLVPELPVRNRSGWVGWAAAAVVLLLVGGWWFRGIGDAEVASSQGIEATQPADSSTAELPPALVLSVNRASAQELEDQLAVLESWDPVSQRSWTAGEETGYGLWNGEMFPDVEELDVDTREQLLDWLRDQNTGSEGAKG